MLAGARTSLDLGMPSTARAAGAGAHGGVFVLDSNSVLGQALCTALLRAGHTVVAHTRVDPPPGVIPDLDAGLMRKLSAARADALVAGWDDTRFPLRHVVFAPPSEIAADPSDLDALTNRLEERLTLFLAELQAAGRLLSRYTGGQIWVLTREDSMRYAMADQAPNSAAPIETRARQAAVKSFAKEMFRFGVRINCAAVQPAAEEFSPEAWQAARGGTKAFALRFRPNPVATIATALCSLLAQDALPIAGMVVPLGIGFAEQNI